MAWDFIISGGLHFSSETQIEQWFQTAIHPEQYGDEVFPFTQPLKWISFDQDLTVEKFMFRCAGVCGATGELYFIGIGNTIAFKITTSPEKTEIIELSAEVANELVESERTMAIMNWGEKQIHARMKKKKS